MLPLYTMLVTLQLQFQIYDYQTKKYEKEKKRFQIYIEKLLRNSRIWYKFLWENE